MDFGASANRDLIRCRTCCSSYDGRSMSKSEVWSHCIPQRQQMFLANTGMQLSIR